MNKNKEAINFLDKAELTPSSKRFAVKIADAIPESVLGTIKQALQPKPLDLYCGRMVSGLATSGYEVIVVITAEEILTSFMSDNVGIDTSVSRYEVEQAIDPLGLADQHIENVVKQFLKGQ